MIYKALSVVDTAGKRIRDGLKKLEIRKWLSDKMPLSDVVIVQNSIRLSSSGISHDPNGRALALVDFIDFTDWTEEQLEESCASYWESGWYAWRIANVRPISTIITPPAKLRIYEIDLNDGITKQ